MKKGELLSKALMLATTKHDGQFDRGGVPYVMHCLKVLHYTKSDDEEVQMIAVLHDVVEDTDVTYKLLRDMGFSERVIDGIRCLTKVPGETEEEYLAKVMSNKDAIIVKLADLRHNSDIRRLKGVTEKDVRRIEKYHRMYLTLRDLT